MVVTSENSSEFMLGLAEVTCRADGERLLVTSGEVAREGGAVDSVVLDAPSANPSAPQRANRATSTLDGSEGTLRFETLGCGDEPGVSLTIDAVLASVYDDRGPVPVEGALWVTNSRVGQ